MPDQFILYDLPSRGTPTCWSYNPWKTRMALNYKQISYHTEWTEYPDIAAKFESFGIKPNLPNEGKAYAIPAARFPDGSYVMDSFCIAQALEKFQPEPSMHLDNGYIEKIRKAAGMTLQALAPLAVPRVPELLLNKTSQDYFNEDRSKRFGMPLTEIHKTPDAMNAWESAQPGIEGLKALLHENDGPFIAGKEVCYADFILAGIWRFYERLDKDGDLFAKIMSFDNSFAEHLEACKPWMQRDGY